MIFEGETLEVIVDMHCINAVILLEVFAETVNTRNNDMSISTFYRSRMKIRIENKTSFTKNSALESM